MKSIAKSAALPALLAFLALLAYGLLVPWLGLYADDWTFVWTSEILKLPGELRYFFYAAGRPVWGLFYHFTLPLLGHTPWLWHLFSAFWLWAGALLVGWLVRLVWPGRLQLSFMAAAFFLVYPGMQLESSPVTTGHMWLTYAIFLGSLCFGLLALRKPRAYLALSALSLLASAVNLLSFEYFFTLELARLALFWLAAGSQPTWMARLRYTLKIWLPYALLLTGIVVWRVTALPQQTGRYQLSLLSQLQAEPLATLGKLATTVFGDVFWQSTALAWGQTFALPFSQLGSGLAGLAGPVLLAVSALAVGLYLWRTREPAQSGRSRTVLAFEMLAAGLFALFAAGCPFWLTGIAVVPDEFSSRFTMPFMLGAALLLTGLIALIPWRLGQWLTAALLVGFAVSAQFQSAESFRRDWLTQKDFFWQLSWRMPGLTPGSILMTNNLQTRYFSDNTNSALLNWITARQQAGYRADYVMSSISELKRLDISTVQKSVAFKRRLLSIDFYGTTDRAVVLNYLVGSCLRVLDPRFDPLNATIHGDSQAAAVISNPGLIQRSGSVFELPREIFGTSPNQDACFTYEKAELAGQAGDWSEVNRLGEQFELKPRLLARDPMIAAVFIEAAAHTGQAEHAAQISRQTLAAQPLFQPVLCSLWDVLKADLPSDATVQGAADGIKKEIDCK